jgi:hypothetical protein
MGGIITMHQQVTDEHLTEVMAEMETLGAPKIHAVWYGDVWYALEGVHRLNAAYKLGLTPEIIAVPYGDGSATLSEVIDDYSHDDDYTIDQIIDNTNGDLLDFDNLNDGE